MHVCMCTLHTTVLYTVDKGVQFTVYSETWSLGHFSNLSIKYKFHCALVFTSKFDKILASHSLDFRLLYTNQVY